MNDAAALGDPGRDVVVFDVFVTEASLARHYPSSA